MKQEEQGEKKSEKKSEKKEKEAEENLQCHTSWQDLQGFIMSTYLLLQSGEGNASTEVVRRQIHHLAESLHSFRQLTWCTQTLSVAQPHCCLQSETLSITKPHYCLQSQTLCKKATLLPAITNSVRKPHCCLQSQTLCKEATLLPAITNSL